MLFLNRSLAVQSVDVSVFNDRTFVIGGGSFDPVCNELEGLSAGQSRLCQMYPDHMPAVRHGLKLAIAECQHQLQWRRWNCSTTNDSSVFGPLSNFGQFVEQLACCIGLGTSYCAAIYVSCQPWRVRTTNDRSLFCCLLHGVTSVVLDRNRLSVCLSVRMPVILSPSVTLVHCGHTAGRRAIDIYHFIAAWLLRTVGYIPKHMALFLHHVHFGSTGDVFLALFGRNELLVCGRRHAWADCGTNYVRHLLRKSCHVMTI